jgi:hypothetical protein
MTSNESILPFLLQNATFGSVSGEALGRDAITAEDPLPVVLDIDVAGLAVVRETRVTDVQAETLDDN